MKITEIYIYPQVAYFQHISERVLLRYWRLYSILLFYDKMVYTIKFVPLGGSVCFAFCL